MTTRKQTHKTFKDRPKLGRRLSRLEAQRVDYAREFIGAVQAAGFVGEIQKQILMKRHQDFARQRRRDALSEAQLFRAMKLAGVSSRQVDRQPGDWGFDSSKTGRQRVTVYRLPRVPSLSAGPSKQLETFGQNATGARLWPPLEKVDWPEVFLIATVAASIIGGVLLGMSDVSMFKT